MAGSNREFSGCGMCRHGFRALKWLPVVLITSIVVWSYYAYVVELCWNLVANPVVRVAFLVPYHVLLIMFLWSYARTIFAEIQPIPVKFKLPSSEMEKLLAAENEDAQRQILDYFARDLPIVTRTATLAIRYCHRCAIVKPDRAHHCSVCGACVLKMDHHCPWVNNCVCFHNYKFFVLFLGYALAYCLLIVVTAMPYFIQVWKRQFPVTAGPTLATAGQFHVVFVFFVAVMFGISLGSLFGYHCYLVAHNRTTLESFRAPMFRSGPDKNGFSLGTSENFREVFGRKPLLWPLPVFTSAGDGSGYLTRPEHRAVAACYEAMGVTRPSEQDTEAWNLCARSARTVAVV